MKKASLLVLAVSLTLSSCTITVPVSNTNVNGHSNENINAITNSNTNAVVSVTDDSIVLNTPAVSAKTYSVRNPDAKDFYRQELVEKDRATAKETVLISNIQKTLGFTYPNEMLGLRGVNTGAKLSIWTKTPMDTDGGITGIYVFNETTKTFSELALPENACIHNSNFLLSPNNEDIACVIEDEAYNTLYVINVVSGKATKVKQLPTNQTFNQGAGGIGSNFILQWKDEETIIARIFRSNSAIQESNWENEPEGEITVTYARS